MKTWGWVGSKPVRRSVQNRFEIGSKSVRIPFANRFANRFKMGSKSVRNLFKIGSKSVRNQFGSDSELKMY